MDAAVVVDIVCFGGFRALHSRVAALPWHPWFGSSIFFSGAIGASVGTSALMVASTIPKTFEAAPAGYRSVYYYLVIERSLDIGLAIFLLLLLVFVAWFSIPLSRNLLTHCLVYSSYFLINNVLFLYRHTVGEKAATLINVAKLSTALGCFFCWLWFLSRQGEESTGPYA